MAVIGTVEGGGGVSCFNFVGRVRNADAVMVVRGETECRGVGEFGAEAELSKFRS